MNHLPLFPTSYENFKLKHYTELINLLPAEAPDEDDIEGKAEVFEIYFKVFTGVDLADADINSSEYVAIMNRINSFGNLPDKPSTKLKLKTEMELTTNEFIEFQSYIKNPLQYLPEILKIYLIDKTIDVNEMSVADAYGCFFLLQKYNKRYLKRFKISLAWKAIKQILLQWFSKRKHR